jgi:predicted PurR-regulated permease PerM
MTHPDHHAPPPDEPVTINPVAERQYWPTGVVARATLVVLAVFFGLRLLWSISSLVFLVFLATLFGLAVGRGVDYLQRFRIRRGIASALIVFGTLGAIGGGLALSAPTLVEQGQQLQREFPEAVNKVQTWIDSKQRTGATAAIIKAAANPSSPAASPVPTTPAKGATAKAPPTIRPSDALKQRLAEGLQKASGYLFSFVSSTLAVLTAFVLLVFLAIYIGAEPDVYRGWMLAAVPAGSRATVRTVLGEVATVLRKWLVTQLVAMIVIGVVSTVILLILGVKAPFALGFIAGLLEFIPSVGPVLAAVPAVLMGFVDSPEKALAVVVAYWGIQFVENNLLIPYLMRGEMDLPPAITLVAQAIMTLVFGFIGLMVAVPLTAAVLVPLRMIAVRENAREKELKRAARREAAASHADMRVTAEHAVRAADRGPQTMDLAEGDY